MIRAGQRKIAPCQDACPAGIDVPRYVRAIQKGRFGEALAVVREKIPFPLVCGYACVHPCEARCARNQFEGPVAIRRLKWAAAAYDRERLWQGEIRRHPPTGKRVGVVGAGPAGLTAAYYLAALGHGVTVFEALPFAGGMLRFGIPEYRLPREVLESEIREIEKAGVEIRTHERIESLDNLMDEKGYHAVLLALGAHKGMRLAIPGSHLQGVWVGVDFLRDVHLGKRVEVGERVLVLGGGNVALDCARVARRLGAREVGVAFPESRDRMPAASEEIEQGEEEGVVLYPSRGFARILGEDAAIEGVECLDVAAFALDENEGVRIETRAGSEHVLPADMVIFAVGQRPEIPEGFNLKCEGGNRIRVDPRTCKTGREGVFAVGDAIGGTASLIEAIASGRKGADEVDRHLGGAGLIDRLAEEVPYDLPEEAPRGTHRAAAETASPEKRLESFEPVEKVYDPATAMREAGRCLSCDLREFDVTVNEAACKSCSYCREVCGPNVFERSDRFNPGGYRPFVPSRAEHCIGCLKCLYICPDFAITIRDKR
ncbi:MAG: FAD-dependent oxidoreductase [Thermodesulfobacteriota bacterium]